jgi:formylmethanofuran dehydrogenase subunit E
MTTAEWMIANKIDKWVLKNEPKKKYSKPTIKPKVISIIECGECGAFCSEENAIYDLCPSCANFYAWSNAA